MEPESNRVQKRSGCPKNGFFPRRVTSRESSSESLENANKPTAYFLNPKKNFSDLCGRFFIKFYGQSDGLGTFTGVFIPTCENMWGVLIFLRFFYIVGNAGIWQSFLIVFLSFLCAFLTSMSLSAIATNGPIEEGGTYFLLSRALGPQIGGAVGCMYFLGLLLLAVLESLGAVEVMKFTFTTLDFPSANQVLGAFLLLLLGIVVLFGIKFVSKLGAVFFVVVLYTLSSYLMGLALAPQANSPHSLTGLSWKTFRGNWKPGYERGISFSVIISVFFPCFTGILSGADRAKSLQGPERSIPAGTLGAVVISLFLYLLYIGLWGAVGTREYLLGKSIHKSILLKNIHSENNKLMAVKDVAYPIEIVTELGIIIASISQALQCLITAPRVLQAIAGDGIIPLINWLGKTSACGEPKRALILTTVLCMMAAMAGSLDHIAPLVSICFLTCYSALNSSCFILSIVNAPSWRPKWKYYHWSFALVGLVVCLAMSFLILWYWALIAILALLAVYAYIHDCQVEVDWGTGLGGLWLQLSVESLLCVGQEAHYSVNWRPQLLCLLKHRSTWSKKSHSQSELLSFASILKKGKGLCVVTTILEGKIQDMAEKAAEHKVKVESLMQATGVTGFARALVAQSYRQSKTYVIQSSGIGPLEPNTVLLGWPTKWRQEKHKDRAPIFLETLVECKAADKAVLICMNMCNFPTAGTPQEGKVDVWWIVQDGGLLLILAHLILRHKLWRKCKLRVRTVSKKQDNPVLIKKNLNKLLERVRINAEVEVLELDESIRLEDAMTFEERYAHHRKLQQVHAYNSMDQKSHQAPLPRAADRKSSDKRAAVLDDNTDLKDLLKHVPPRCKTGHNSPAYLHSDECPYAGVIELRENCDQFQCTGMCIESDQKEVVRTLLEERATTQNCPFSKLELPFPKEAFMQANADNKSELKSGTGCISCSDVEAKSDTVGCDEKSPEICSSFLSGNRENCNRLSIEDIFCADTQSSEGENLEVVIEDLPKEELDRQKKQEMLQNRLMPLKEIHDIEDTRRRSGPLPPAIYQEALEIKEDSSSCGQLFPCSHNISYPHAMRRCWGSFSESCSAKAMNQLILKHSHDAGLVLLSLPEELSQGMQACEEYMEYCEELTKGLKRVIFVRGIGREL